MKWCVLINMVLQGVLRQDRTGRTLVEGAAVLHEEQLQLVRELHPLLPQLRARQRAQPSQIQRGAVRFDWGV